MAGNVHVAWADNTDYGGSGPDRDILYKVRARVPETPVLLPVVPGTSVNGMVDLAWQPAAGAMWYHVYRSTSPITTVSKLSPVARVAGTAFADTVPSNGEWHYVVVGGNQYYNGSMSNGVSVIVEPSLVIPREMLYFGIALVGGLCVVMLLAGVVIGKRSMKQKKTAKRS